jgi:hypothetical protein
MRISSASSLFLLPRPARCRALTPPLRRCGPRPRAAPPSPRTATAPGRRRSRPSTVAARRCRRPAAARHRRRFRPRAARPGAARLADTAAAPAPLPTRPASVAVAAPMPTPRRPPPPRRRPPPRAPPPRAAAAPRAPRPARRPGRRRAFRAPPSRQRCPRTGTTNSPSQPIISVTTIRHFVSGSHFPRQNSPSAQESMVKLPLIEE